MFPKPRHPDIDTGISLTPSCLESHVLLPLESAHLFIPTLLSCGNGLKFFFLCLVSLLSPFGALPYGLGNPAMTHHFYPPSPTLNHTSRLSSFTKLLFFFFPCCPSFPANPAFLPWIALARSMLSLLDSASQLPFLMPSRSLSPSMLLWPSFPPVTFGYFLLYVLQSSKPPTLGSPILFGRSAQRSSLFVFFSWLTPLPPLKVYPPHFPSQSWE